MDFALVILMALLIDGQKKDFTVSAKPIGIVGAQLACEKLAADLQFTLPKDQTAVCVKIRRNPFSH